MSPSKEARVMDGIIMVSHQLSPPTVTHFNGALEFDGEGVFASAQQKLLRDFMAHALGEFARFRKDTNIDVESRLRLESPDETEFPATIIVRIIGTDISSAQVEDYRAAAQAITRVLVRQSSLGETDLVGRLTDEEQSFLSEKGNELQARFANRLVTQGFFVSFGAEQLGGVTIQGTMPTLVSDEAVQERIQGTARLIGFDEARLKVSLQVESVNDGAEAKGRLEALCPNERFLRILAGAYANRHMVEFLALRQPSVGRSRSVITLVELEEISSNDPEFFQLD